MAIFRKPPADVPRRRQVADSTPERATSESLHERYAFRRNRTLTGSASSSVSALSESTAQLKSARVHSHSLVRTRRRLMAVLGIIVIGGALLLVLVSQLTASVDVRLSGSSQALSADYADTIQSYFGSVPAERLRFLMNTDELLAYIQRTHPEVRTIEVEGSAGLGSTSFVLTMRQPVVGWLIGGSQQYVDDTGTAFRINYSATPAVTIVDKTGVPVTSGQAVASNRFLGFVGRMIGAMRLQGYSTKQVIIPEATSRQIELILTDPTYPVIISIDRGEKEQAEDAARAIAWFKSKGKTPQYIDVRVSGKAFYRE